MTALRLDDLRSMLTGRGEGVARVEILAVRSSWFKSWLRVVDHLINVLSFPGCGYTQDVLSSSSRLVRWVWVSVGNLLDGRYLPLVADRARKDDYPAARCGRAPPRWLYGNGVREERWRPMSEGFTLKS